MVIGVPGEIWGLSLETGKLKWFAESELTGNVGPSPVAQDGIVYLMGGYPRQQSVAVRAGGKGDVTQTRILWNSRDSSYIPSPVLHDGNLYWVSDQGIANCVDAKTGKNLWTKQLGSGIGQSAISYAVNGKQYIAVVVGRSASMPAFLGDIGTKIVNATPEGGTLYVFTQ